MPLRRSSVAAVITTPTLEQALQFLTNEAANSDIRFEWTGGACAARQPHTSIWESNYTQQNGYYGTDWLSGDDDVFRGNGDAGFHPWPADSGAFNGLGEGTAGNASSASHWYEIASVYGSVDHIATGPAASYDTALSVTKGVRITSMATVERITGGTVDRYRYWPNINNDVYLEVLQTVALYPGGVTYKRTKAASPWRKDEPDPGENDETHYGWMRKLHQYAAVKTLAQGQALAALTTNAAVIAHSDATDLWYLNLNPTHTDIADKSGNSHNPAWANSNRPTTVTL